MNQLVKVKNLNKSKSLELSPLDKVVRNPTTIGVLEFLTGLSVTAFDKPADLIGSVGHLVQSLFKRDSLNQLYEEVQKYRQKGRITDEKLNSKYGRIIFTELMQTIDDENLDKDKFEALKNIFLKSVNLDTDEHKQMLAYQYFQVCKGLSSLDILILKTAYDIYLLANGRNYLNINHGGEQSWLKEIAGRLGLPEELVTQSRIKNSGLSQDHSAMIFESNAGTVNGHGLTKLGIEICKYITEEK